MLSLQLHVPILGDKNLVISQCDAAMWTTDLKELLLTALLAEGFLKGLCIQG